MVISELRPLCQKSFYGKAIMQRHDGITDLISYRTKVASFNANTGKMTINGWYSATTSRHINAFLDYFGFDTLSKAEMIAWNE